MEHCGPNNDDHLKYRSNKDISYWKNKDPIIKAINKFEKNFGKNELYKLQKNLKNIVDKNFILANKDQLPKHSEAKKFVYA